MAMFLFNNRTSTLLPNTPLRSAHYGGGDVIVVTGDGWESHQRAEDFAPPTFEVHSGVEIRPIPSSPLLNVVDESVKRARRCVESCHTPVAGLKKRAWRSARRLANARLRRDGVEFEEDLSPRLTGLDIA